MKITAINYTMKTQEISKPYTSKTKRKGTHTHTYTLLYHHNNHHQHQQNNRNQQSLIIDISQYQWTQFPNKMTETNRVDVETGSILLNTENTPQHQG